MRWWVVSFKLLPDYVDHLVVSNAQNQNQIYGQVYVETHTRNLVLVDGFSQTQQCKTHNISARKEEINNKQYIQTTIQNIKE